MGTVNDVKASFYKTSSYPSIKLDELRIIAETESGAATITCSLNCPARVLHLDIFGTKACCMSRQLSGSGSYEPLKSSFQPICARWEGVNDILAPLWPLVNISAGVISGSINAETYGHRYLLKASINSIINKKPYPIGTLAC